MLDMKQDQESRCGLKTKRWKSSQDTSHLPGPVCLVAGYYFLVIIPVDALVKGRWNGEGIKKCCSGKRCVCNLCMLYLERLLELDGADIKYWTPCAQEAHGRWKSHLVLLIMAMNRSLLADVSVLIVFSLCFLWSFWVCQKRVVWAHWSEDKGKRKCKLPCITPTWYTLAQNTQGI